MDNVLLYLLAGITLLLLAMLIKTLYWQKKLAPHLLLNKNKNNRILAKQSSYLLVSALAFTFVYVNPLATNNTFDFSKQRTYAGDSVVDIASEYAKTNEDSFEGDFASLDIVNWQVLGNVTLADKTFALVERQGTYLLVNESDNIVIEIESAP